MFWYCLILFWHLFDIVFDIVKSEEDYQNIIVKDAFIREENLVKRRVRQEKKKIKKKITDYAAMMALNVLKGITFNFSK